MLSFNNQEKTMTSRLTSHWLALFGLASLLAGCVATGWQFGPGYSLNDTDTELGKLFTKQPVIEQRTGGYYLTWTQGDYPFFFQPDYKAMNGRLVFAMVATSSSGSLAGRYREMRIEGASNIDALREGGAFWWEREPEPNGKFVSLEIREINKVN
jgi:hypothetical protein